MELPQEEMGCLDPVGEATKGLLHPERSWMGRSVSTSHLHAAMILLLFWRWGLTSCAWHRLSIH